MVCLFTAIQILYVPEPDISSDDDDSYQKTSSIEQPGGDSLASSFVEEVAPTHIRIRAKYITTDQVSHIQEAAKNCFVILPLPINMLWPFWIV